MTLNQEMQPQPQPQMDQDRRCGTDRRQNPDRRCSGERRADYREDPGQRKKIENIRVWIRSKTNARLGVDRRKGERRSGFKDRRQPCSSNILTQDEIRDLLSPLK